MQSVDFPNADGASEEMCAANTGNRERVLSAEKFRLYIIMAEPEFLAQKTGCVIERDIVQVGEKDGIVFSRNVECARIRLPRNNRNLLSGFFRRERLLSNLPEVRIPLEAPGLYRERS